MLQRGCVPLRSQRTASQADLRKRGRLGAETPSRLDLGIMLMDEYIRYPYSAAAIPFNYCALGAVMPALQPLLSSLC